MINIKERVIKKIWESGERRKKNSNKKKRLTDLKWWNFVFCM